ncbi:hypothetical protein GCM10020331_020220 [Ectobacillus funiculus]
MKKTDTTTTDIKKACCRIFASSSRDDIREVQVINESSIVLATSDQYNQGIVGKKTTDILVKRTLLSGASDKKRWRFNLLMESACKLPQFR